jgi:hypothetical protein
MHATLENGADPLLPNAGVVPLLEAVVEGSPRRRAS